MEFVQPIRDKNKLAQMKIALLKKGMRDYILFVLGINTGLRISDLLTLKVLDVKEQTHLVKREKKTGKIRRFRISGSLRSELDAYIADMRDYEYLFRSRKGNGPITKVQAYRILNNAAKSIGLSEIGTHTLRKTFGYHFYQKTQDIALLQQILNHTSPSDTMKYIGINQDMIDKALDAFEI